jgi:hypothetical protein
MDLTEYVDPRGNRIFVGSSPSPEQGRRYVEYVWQWKDLPERLAPKSYVKASIRGAG